MSRLTCLHCQATTEGVVLCKRCQVTASVALEAIAARHADLFTLGVSMAPVRRRSGSSDPTGSAATSRRDDPIEKAAAETQNMLSGWVRILVEDRGLAYPRDSVGAMAAFLSKHMRSVATLAWAGELMRDLLADERRLKLVVSRNRGHWYAGICRARTGDGPDDWCPADLFVTPGDTWVRCRVCRHQWSVKQRRAEVIAQAHDMLLPVALIARAAVALLDDVEPSQQRLEARLRKWVERGLLDDYGVRVLEGRPRRVYRLGDVIDRLTREASGVSA